MKDFKSLALKDILVWNEKFPINWPQKAYINRTNKHVNFQHSTFWRNGQLRRIRDDLSLLHDNSLCCFDPSQIAKLTPPLAQRFIFWRFLKITLVPRNFIKSTTFSSSIWSKKELNQNNPIQHSQKFKITK